MTQWQQVEQAFTQLFCMLLSSEGNVASAIFNAVLSFRTKLAMLRAAAAVRLTDKILLDECIKLCDRMEKKAAKRNEIAHFMLYQRAIVSSHGEAVDKTRLERDLDWYLSPTAFDAARNWRYKKGVPTLTRYDVMNRAQSFINASNEIWQFSEKARVALAKHPKSP